MGNYLSLSNRKDANLCLNAHRNTFGGRALPAPTGSLWAPPDPLATMGGATYKETDGKGEVGNSAMS